MKTNLKALLVVALLVQLPSFLLPGAHAQAAGRFNQTLLTSPSALTSLGVSGVGASVAAEGLLFVVGTTSMAALVYLCPYLMAPNCTQSAVLLPLGGSSISYSPATPVDLYNGIVALGMPYATINGTSDQGAVFLYNCSTVTGNCTNTTGPLYATNGLASDELGSSVGLGPFNGGQQLLVVAGAPQRTVGSNTTQGVAYVFACDLDGQNCTQGEELGAPDGFAGQLFGSAIAVSQSSGLPGLVAIGAPYNGYSNLGLVYVYVCTTASSCSLTSELSNSTAIAFGTAVALDGPLLVVGCPWGSQVLIFVCTSAGQCSFASILTDTSSTLFGASVASENGIVVVGAPYSTVGNTGLIGQVSIYLCNNSTGACTPSQFTYATANDGKQFDDLGKSVAISGLAIIAGATGRANGGAAYVFSLSSSNNYTAVCAPNFSGPNCTVCPSTLPDILGNSCVAQCTNGTFLDTNFNNICTTCDPACTLCTSGAFSSCSACATGYTLLNSTCIRYFQGTMATPAEGLTSDQLGTSIAISGGLLAMGGPTHTAGTGPNSNSSQGIAYVFQCSSPTTCTEGSTLAAPDGKFLSYFGASIAADSSTGYVLVGSPDFEINYANAGTAYLFSCNSSASCTFGTEFQIDAGLFVLGNFGNAVALSGNLIIIASVQANSNYGAVFFYNCTTATSCAGPYNVTAPDATSGDGFGQAVAALGSTVVIGAPYASPSQGAVYLYSCPTASSCSFQTKLTSINATSNQDFGNSVGVTSSGLIVVGCPECTDVNNNLVGVLFVYLCPTLTTCTLATILSSAYVSIGSTIAVSAGGVIACTASNYVVTFQCTVSGGTTVNCTQGSTIASPEGYDSFSAVSVSGTWVAGGIASWNVGNNPQQGAGFVYTLPSNTSAFVACVQGFTGATCTSCATGYTGTYCNTCTSGYYSSAGSCLVCASGCTSCITANNCTACASGFYLDTTSSLCAHSPTPSPTASYTRSSTATLSYSASATHSATASFTESFTFTPSASASATASYTASFTQSATNTLSATDSYTQSATNTLSATESYTQSFTNTPSATASYTQSFTNTPSATASYTQTATNTLSATDSYTQSATNTLSATESYTQSATNSLTASATTSSTPTPVACADVTEGNATWPLAALGSTVQGVCLSGFAGQPSRYCAFSGVYGPISTACLPIAPVPSSAFAASLVVSDTGSSYVISVATTIKPTFVLASPIQVVWETTAPLSSLPTTGTSLTFAKTQIPPGTYTFVTMITASTSTLIDTLNATTSLTIGVLPPVVILAPNVASFAAAYDLPLVLNASASLDPNAGSSGVSCAWSSPNANVSFSSGCVQTVAANTLSTGSTYTFSVQVTSTAYGTSAVASVQVVVQGSVAATVTVTVQGVSPSGVVASQGYTRLAGTYQLAAGYTASQTTYQWNCTAAVNGTCPDLTNTASVVASQLNSYNLVLFPGALVAGSQYTFRLTVTTQNPPGSGFGEVAVNINLPPASGSFAVTPLQGVQFQDVFTLLVGNWIDPEGGALLYNYVAASTYLLAQPSSQDTLFTSSLPHGQMQLWAIVSDDTGDSVQTAAIAVNVTSNITSVAQLQQVAAQQLAQAAQSQDPSAILQIVNAVAQLLATQGSNDPTVAAQVRFNLTVAIQAAASLQTLSSANVAVLVQALNSVASNTAELSSDSLDLILQLTTELASLAGSAAQQFLTIIATIDGLLSSANSTATLQQNIAAVVTSLLTADLCDQNAQLVSAGSLQVTGQKSSSLGNSTVSDASFGSAFAPSTAADCTEIHAIQSGTNPYAYVNTTGANLTVSSTSAFTLNFYDASTNQPLLVLDLSPDGSITLTFDDVPNATNDSVQCVFFNETTGAWDAAGCTKSNASTTATTLVCLCNHATTFSIGNFQFDINQLEIPTSINADSVGLIASVVAVVGLFVMYILLAAFAIFKDQESVRTAEAPSEKDLVGFGERVLELWGHRAPHIVLTTMHLDAWKDAYGLNLYPKGSPCLTFMQRFYVGTRMGLKYNHAYFFLFFQPTTPGTRLARISTTIASIFMTLVVSATFFQDTASSSLITMSEVEQKVFAGMVSSVIVFVPFSFLGFFMRRVKHAHQVRSGYNNMDKNMVEMTEKPEHQSTSESLDDFFEPPHWADVLVPKSVEYILYALLLAGSLVSSIMAIFYGIQFNDTEASNWIESFFIGWAVSAIFLQSVQAIVGSVLTTVVGAISTLATGLALLITNSAIN